MAKFNRGGKKEVPPLATTSLPDIVFMLLFFFMATTQLREETALVTVKLPQASEIAKLERKDLATASVFAASKVFQAAERAK